MLKIIIQNLDHKTISSEVSSGAVLHVLHTQGVDWMHACGGKGRCTTCKMIVIDGMENLSALSPFEIRCRELKALKDNERLACQCTLQHELTIRVPESGKMPHLTYSE